MKTKINKLLLASLILAVVSFSTRAQDAQQILQKMDEVLYAPNDLVAVNTIVLTDRNGNQEMREAYVKQKGTDKRIMRFTAPASQAGIAVLALPDNVMYLYLPAFGRERRIAASVKNQHFAGTDFSYDDMEPKPYSEKYAGKLLQSENDVHVLELTPKGRSDYSKIIAQINKIHYYPQVMEYYDRGNNKIKEAKYTFQKIGKYWNAKEIEMTDLKRKHKTSMQMSDVEYDTGLSDDEFTVRKLKQ